VVGSFTFEIDGSHEVYKMKLDGSNIIRLTYSNGGNAIQPEWSP